MFAACGGGGGGGSTQDNIKHTTIQMTPQKSYPLVKGDVIVRDQEGSEVVLDTNVKTKRTVATLKKGSAHIERVVAK